MPDTNRENILLENFRKELRLTRILCSVVCVLLVCTLLGGALIYGRIRAYAGQMQPLADALAQVDYEVLNETMSNLSASLEEVDLAALTEQLSQVDWKALAEDIDAVDWKSLSEDIDSVDWKALSENINSIDWDALSDELSKLDVEALNEALAGLDTKELTTTLKNLNEAAESMKSFSDSFKGLFGKIGIGNKN